MGRDELTEMLARLRRQGSIDQLHEELGALQHELLTISRKRSYFLEDACAVVLKLTVAALGRRSGSDDDVGSSSDDELRHTEAGGPDVERAVEVCVAFAEPLIDALQTSRSLEGDDDTQRQRAVLVAFLLHVLSRPVLPIEEHTEQCDAAVRTASLLLRCGIDVVVVIWTLRFREELAELRTYMTPTWSDQDHDASDNEADMLSDTNDSGEDENNDKDEQWLLRFVADAMGLRPFTYFLKESGQEYAFASWSIIGIVRLLSLLVARNQWIHRSTILAPLSQLFAVAAAAQVLLRGATLELKSRGLKVLARAADSCSPNVLHLRAPANSAVKPSFDEACQSFRQRDWISPLLELVSNAMVSFPESSDRTVGLTVFTKLMNVVCVDDRFWLVQALAIRCPYGNIAAILVDQLRGDTVHSWVSDNHVPSSPYTSYAVSGFIVELIRQTCERDVKLQADLLASIMSLLRFVILRDKENCTGIQTKSCRDEIIRLLSRLHRRLHSVIVEWHPHSTTGSESVGTHNPNIEYSRLMLVEAGLESTLEAMQG